MKGPPDRACPVVVALTSMGAANARSKRGEQVSVYLKTDADLDERWGAPGLVLH
jgi:hypothetical protein